MISNNLAVDRFSAVSAFAKVVEVGSFARAAERLSLSTSAVSRQVSELESHLEVRLLNRTTRRLSLTEAGQAYYERCVQVLADLDEAEASVRNAALVPSRVTGSNRPSIRNILLIASSLSFTPTVSSLS